MKIMLKMEKKNSDLRVLYTNVSCSYSFMGHHEVHERVDL